MTDEAKALVERLRLKSLDTRETSPATCDDAANLIETQAREIERLRERLEIDPTHSMDGIYARDETIRGLDAQLAKWKALAETLAGALEQIVEGAYPRPLGKPWRMDASSSKHDRCTHDAWMYETCEGCLDAFVAEALREYKEARDETSN